MKYIKSWMTYKPKFQFLNYNSQQLIFVNMGKK